MKTSMNLSVATASRMTRLALVGLAFALVAMMTVPVMAAESVVPGNPTHLSEYRINDPVTGTYMYGEIEINIVVSSTEMGEVFSFTSSAPVVRAVAKGGTDGATVYTYDPPVMSGSGLHAPLNPSGKWADLSWIGFSFGEPPGEEPPGEEPPGEEPPGEEPPGEEPPGEEPPAEEPPVTEEEPFLPFTEVEEELVEKAEEEEFLPFTGGPATLLLGSALAALAGTALRRLGR